MTVSMFWCEPQEAGSEEGGVRAKTLPQNVVHACIRYRANEEVGPLLFKSEPNIMALRSSPETRVNFDRQE